MGSLLMAANTGACNGDASPPARLSLIRERQIALMRFAHLGGWWMLNPEEEAALLGIPPQAMPLQVRTLAPAIERRIEDLVMVCLTSREAGESPDWLRRRSRLCGGRTPLAVLAEDEAGIDEVLEALLYVKLAERPAPG